jgi:hypothetical protein
MSSKISSGSEQTPPWAKGSYAFGLDTTSPQRSLELFTHQKKIWPNNGRRSRSRLTASQGKTMLEHVPKEV